MNEILLDIPEEFETERLTLRTPRPGDGAEAHAAIVESAEQLRIWIPWAKPLIPVEEEETLARQRRAKFMSRERLFFYMYLKGTSTMVGMSALHHVEWKVPKFEIGYWVRTSFAKQGYATETAHGLTRLAFDCLGARRVEIRTDQLNERSWRVAERAGFTFEGVSHNDMRNGEGKLYDARVYAKTRMDT